MRKEKALLGAIFVGVVAGSGVVSATNVLPSCDYGAYVVLGNENPECQPTPAAKPEVKPAPQPQPVVEQPQPVQQPTQTIIEKRERVFTDWGPYKQKSPEELLAIIRSLLQQQSPAVSYPRNAPVGCCYGKLVKPPVYKQLIIKYVKEDGGYKVIPQPAQFRTVEKKILVRPAYHKVEVIPAKYEIKQEKIMIAPPRAVWKYHNGVYCKVEIPAEYITITRKVMVEPPKCKKVLVPAEYKVVKVQELVRDASCTKQPIPPKYDTITKTVMVKGPEVIWDAILCNVNLRPDEIKLIQERLKELGYYNGPINGQLDDTTMAAIVKFQVDHNLPAGNVSIQTLEAMGLNQLAQNYTKCEIKNLR